MDLIMFLVLIMFIFCICFIIGMVKPSLVIRWGNSEKRNRTKVFLYYGLGAIFLYVFTRMSAIDYIANNIGVNKNHNSYQTQTSTISKEIVTTTPKEIYNDFDNNKISANKKYKDKNISITGKIYVITEDGGTPSIGLVNVDNKYEITIPEVYCSFPNNNQNDKIEKLSKGQTVTIQGTLDMGGSSIYIKDCALK